MSLDAVSSSGQRTYQFSVKTNDNAEYISQKMNMGGRVGLYHDLGTPDEEVFFLATS